MKREGCATNEQGPAAEQGAFPVTGRAGWVEKAGADVPFAGTHVDRVKEKSVQGAVVSLFSQGLRFGLQTGTMMIVARLLTPEDFGLNGMVVAVTGFLALFKDAGLSMATVQRDVVTHDQTSTLFWINAAVGVCLTALTISAAPLLAAFYQEPQLFWVAIVSSAAFLFNGLAAQHQALLQRSMRFGTIAKIDVISLALGSAVGITMAATGCRYWALVGMALMTNLCSVAGAWLAVPWLPGRPTHRSGVGSMLRFGGTITLNTVLVYVTYNIEKVLLGRFWGAEVLGLYGRAYQLITLPTTQLNSSIAAVAYPALSRFQHDARRLRSSFLKGYSVFLALAVPTTIWCVVFSDEIVRVVLGPKWGEAAPIFRLMGPMVLAFGLINPMSWLLLSSGQVGRSLRIAFLIAPVAILGVLISLSHGPKGVALAYSVVMTLLAVPVIGWAKHGTLITSGDILRAVRGPLVSGMVAGLLALGVEFAFRESMGDFPRFAFGSGALACSYLLVLFYIMREKELYLDLLRTLRLRAGGEQA